MDTNNEIENLNIELERDIFLRNLLRELSGVLEDVIGLDEASGFISIVGQHIGNGINHDYRKALSTDKLNSEQVTSILVDLKRRIQGDFYIIHNTTEKTVLGNRCCPFGESVKDRPSLCMMTSNVFGTIVAENLGYAKICMQETIAQGAPECRITVHKQASDASDADEGREYYKS